MPSAPAFPATRTDAVRAFSRFYTARLGVLSEGLLDTPFSLTEARVLYELGQSARAESAALGVALALDSGYLSRILQRFERDQLIARERSAADARRRPITLTAAGRRAARTLNARSAQQVAALLAPLSERQQRELVAAMSSVRTILGDPPTPAAIVLRGIRPGDLGWVVQRHGELYAQEYGWDETFEGLVARIVADYVDHRDTQRENAWIAELGGERAGCVFCVRKDARTAQLRILLVEPWARGRGIGALLVDECLRFAKQAGYRKIVLWTNDILVSARRIYTSTGFTLVKSEKHHSFGKDLVGQFWERAL